DISKRSHTNQTKDGIIESNGRISGGIDLGDSEDHLSLREDMMEWSFYAQSIEAPIPDLPDQESIVWRFFGQINFVQFMLFQDSTNVGYASGSIETFEYQRNAYRGGNPGDSITRNGVPMPFKTTRP